MAARKRGHAESFKAYHQNLKSEAAKLKKQLAGKVIWPGQWGTAVIKIIHSKPYLTNGQQTVPLHSRK